MVKICFKCAVGALPSNWRLDSCACTQRTHVVLGSRPNHDS